MAVVFHAAAARRRARQAQPAEIHIRSVSLGLRASLYLVSTPATPEIHAAALFRSLRGAQRWDRACAPKKLKKKKEKRRGGQEPRNATSHSEAQEKYIFFVRRKKPQVVGV